MLRPILSPILKGILQPVLSAQDDVTRWVWTLNGMSFGINPTMNLNESSTYANTFSLPTLPVSTVHLFESDDSLSYLSLSSLGVLSITGSITAKVNDVSVVSGVTSITIDEVITLEITPTAAMSVSNYPSSTLLPTIKNYGLVVNGILNTSAFPGGTADYNLDEPYRESHIAVDSDNPDGASVIRNGELDGDIYVDWYTPGLTYLGSSSFEIEISNGNSLYQRYVNVEPLANYRLSFTLVSMDENLDENTFKWRIRNSSNSSTLTSGGWTSGLGIKEVIFTVPEGSTAISICPFYDIWGGGILVIEDIKFEKTTDMQKFNDLPEDYTEGSV